MENIKEELVEVGDILNILLSSKDDEPENMVIKLVNEANNNGIDIIEISINSPLGKAIYKHKIGEVTNYKVNENIFNVTILSKIEEKVKQKVIE